MSANAGGTYRRLARLGEHYRIFPFPRWNDLGRPSLAEAADGSRTTGYFLLLCGGVERYDVRMVEDGYSLLLSPASLSSFWTALASALRSR